MIEKLLLLYIIVLSLYLVRELHIVRKDKRRPPATDEQPPEAVRDIQEVVVGKAKVVKYTQPPKEPDPPAVYIDKDEVVVEYETLPEENEVIPLEYEGDDLGGKWVSGGVSLNELEHTFETIQNTNADIEHVEEAVETFIKADDTDVMDLLIQFTTPNLEIRNAIDSIMVARKMPPPFKTVLTKEEIEAFDIRQLFY